jgi:acyl-CoA hydrolase
VARSAVDVAKVVVAQINPNMPRTHGDGFIHIDKIHHAVEVSSQLPEEPSHVLTTEELAIGQFASELIRDGSTLQVGIGSIPDAVLGALRNHRHLGLHTELLTDGALDLIERGVIDNSRKKIHRGKSVTGFILGSKRLYDFVDDNPSVIALDIGYVNNPFNISRNPRVVAINSAIEIDLSGQVCADSVGTRLISGAGGQMDFVLGAAQSEGGTSIITLTSRTKKRVSRIVPTLRSGAGVVTPRSHVRYVITEYGIADLYGKTLKERARALIAIAHPDERSYLTESFTFAKQR